jgi:hypothetical protein
MVLKAWEAVTNQPKIVSSRNTIIQACALLLMNGSIISRVSKPDTKISLQ